MNKQEIFTKVKNHLLTQMEKSWNKVVAGCAYRAPNGLMCAVGCLIPDELYTPKMETRIYDQEFIEKFPEVGKLFDKGTLGFLGELQRIHDYYYAKDWKNQLQKFAIKENLEF